MRWVQKRSRLPSMGNGFAAFVYEEVTWPHLTFQFGGRLDTTSYSPLDEEKRDFTSGSGWVGLLFRPAAADDRVTVAVSLARAARNPALEELFYFGPHPGNFRFEIGNPDLTPEHALGFDVSLRWRGARASGEVTYFRNDIANFVFTAPVTPEEFESRIDEFAERFPSRGIGEEEEIGGEEEEEFPIIEYVHADSLLQGFEAHGDFAVTPSVFVEVGLDYVRGTVKELDQPLPPSHLCGFEAAFATSAMRSGRRRGDRHCQVGQSLRNGNAHRTDVSF